VRVQRTVWPGSFAIRHDLESFVALSVFTKLSDMLAPFGVISFALHRRLPGARQTGWLAIARLRR
jgi:hypothetical protein